MSRPVIRNFPAALRSVGGTCTKTSVGVDVAGVAGVSVSFWLKYTVAVGQHFLQFLLTAGAKNGLRINVEANTLKLFLFTNDVGGTGHTLLKPTNMFHKNMWHHVVFTQIWDQASLVTGRLIVDGSDWGSATYAGDIQPTDTFKTTGSATDTVCDVILYNRVLSLAEAQGIYFNDTIPSGASLRWKLDEGAGAVGRDSSGNGLDGTITTSTFTKDVPMKKRTIINDNLLENGDFEYAPPLTAATTGSSRYIDGSAAGSSTNDLFKWFTVLGGSVTGSAQFDTVEKHGGSASMKLVCTVANSGSSVGLFVGRTAQTGPSIANQIASMIPVLPSTQYTVTAWVKTSSLVSNDATGAKIQVVEYTGNTTSNVGVTASSYFTGTNDWTLVTLNITTSATTHFLHVQLYIIGDSTGTAWFDDIQVVKVTPLVRAAAAARDAALTRVAA